MTKKYSLLFFVFILSSVLAYGQSVGDYRTAAQPPAPSPGDWSAYSTWEYWDGDSWEPVTAVQGFPGENPGTNNVYIRPGDEVTLDTDVSEIFSALIIESNATEGGSLIIPENADYDLFAQSVVIEPDHATMNWLGNADIYLLSNSSISAYPGAFVTQNSGNGNDNCSASQIIWLGSRKFSTCSGNAGDNNFDDIENSPAAPTAQEFQQDCGSSITAQATPPAGASVKWYTDQIGGTEVASPTLTVVGTAVYWAASVDNTDPTLESVFRTRVELTLLPEASIDTQPVDVVVFAGDAISFSVTASNAFTYQWQVSSDGGTTFADIDPVVNPSAATSTLVIDDAGLVQNDLVYRVVVQNEGDSCLEVTSDNVTADVRVATVITNRNKTFRVNKN